ncbi:MAG: DUF3370 domain-containing protein [Cyanobacteria bacterium]|nr:DUF3370 domain-containing protein [Cyanobacteriota bacterium]
MGQGIGRGAQAFEARARGAAGTRQPRLPLKPKSNSSHWGSVGGWRWGFAIAGFLLLTWGTTGAIANPPAPAPPETVRRPQDIRPLAPGLDRIPVFNSNSPELVLRPGILLSSFPPTGLGPGSPPFAAPEAHLDFAFRDRFDLFAHHIARADPPEDLRTLYLGVLAGNPGPEPVTVRLLRGASYLSQPDAPFVPMAPWQLNPQGRIFSGPGDRAVATVLRGQRDETLPASVVVPPGGYALLLNAPIPVRDLTPPLNGRSTLLHLQGSAQPIYLASMAQFGGGPDGDRPPTLADWQTLLASGSLAGPRDRAPSDPQIPGPLIYGRVAGIALGSRWTARLTDDQASGVSSGDRLTIPDAGQAISWGISTLAGGTLGTGQIQTAPLLRRYPDTAYAAHGNYGIAYDLTLPLHNPRDRPQTVELRLETPLKFDQPAANQPRGLDFFKTPATATFFRGSVRVRYRSDRGLPQTRYVHLVQTRGSSGDPLVKLTLGPGQNRLVRVELIYPPDATPPQVLTLITNNNP